MTRLESDGVAAVGVDLSQDAWTAIPCWGRLNGQIKVIDQADRKVCDVALRDGTSHRDRANAALITASPNMLRALRMLRSALARKRMRDQDYLLGVIDSAIALADTGRWAKEGE